MSESGQRLLVWKMPEALRDLIVSQIDAQMNLEELFHRYPLVTSEFIERRMHCVGCPLARFETIADACRIYRQPVDDLLAALSSIVNTAAWSQDSPPFGTTGASGKPSR